jgi:glycosyltransferase involved in cell wall biosynthesis
MRILILNWRDVRSPRAGGAESLTHGIARRLVSRGHEVAWFSSASDGLAAAEAIDGVEVVRRGSELTTRLFAAGFARRHAHDLVVEQVNTLPYLTPLWSTAPSILFIHQLAREVWWHEAAPPLAALGWVLEPVYLQAYRRTPVVTVSRSTRDDLLRLGLEASIHVVPEAVDTAPIAGFSDKTREGRLLVVGRLTPSKRIDHAIAALAELRRTHPRATLTIVGDGRDRERLVASAAEHAVAHAVRFAGRVDEDEKTRLLTEADLLLGTSAREGWGLTVTEAALRGTPSVVYSVPGFRDSVLHDRTGLLTEPTPAALAAAARRALNEPALYERLRVAAYAEASALSWDQTTDAFEAAVVAASG